MKEKMTLGVMQIDGVLVGMDKWQQEEIKNLPAGKPLAVVIDENRKIENHRRFFAFINQAFDMQEHYTSKEHLRRALLIKAGYYDKITSHLNGDVSFHAESMDFSSMGEDKFRRVFKDCLDAFHQMLAEMSRAITEDELLRIMEFE